MSVTKDGRFGRRASRGIQPVPADEKADTPGRPKETGSRQQSHAGQSSQSGSSDYDKQLDAGPTADPPKPTREN